MEGWGKQSERRIFTRAGYEKSVEPIGRRPGRTGTKGRRRPRERQARMKSG